MPSRASTHPVVPKQTAQTQAVIAGGKAAIDQRRQAASYGLSGQGQALKDMYDQIQQTGSGYSANPAPTSAYSQWQQQRGFQPSYTPTYGQHEGGKYSGFNTLGELKSAIAGQAEMARQSDQQQAGQLKDTMAAQLGQLDNTYTQSAATPMGANIAALGALGAAAGQAQAPTIGNAIPGLWGSRGAERMGRLDQAGTVARVQGQKTADYTNQLNDWYSKQADPLVSGMETANQIDKTPLRDYAGIAGEQYGVDPALIAGWYPQSSEITDMANQRNLESLHQTGLPYSEQQSTLGQMDAQAGQAAKQATADQQVQMIDDIYGKTTIPGDQLASDAQVPLDAVHQIVTDPQFGFDSYAKTVEDSIAADPAAAAGDATAIQDAVDAAIKAMEDDYASTDPNTGAVIARILHSLYG